MARKTYVELVDDIDGGKADETVGFSIDGVAYEADLSTKNAQKLRDALAPYVEAGTRIGGRRATRKARSGPDNAAVREWAAANGYEVGDRGRIPQKVIDAYTAAH